MAKTLNNDDITAITKAIKPVIKETVAPIVKETVASEVKRVVKPMIDEAVEELRRVFNRVTHLRSSELRRVEP